MRCCAERDEMKLLGSIILLIALQATVAMATPDIEVRKSVNNAFPMINEPVEFTVQVSNVGIESAVDVLIVDQLPAEMRIPAGMAAFPSIGRYDPASGEWFIGDLMHGASATLVIPAVVTDPQPAQCIVNSAVSESGDLIAGNNDARAAIYQNTGYRCVDVRPFPNIFAGASIFPTCDSRGPYYGSIDVRNFGPNAARNVVISVTQTPIIGASIRFDDTQCGQSGLDVCTVAEIPAGQTVSLNVTSDVFQNHTDINYHLALSVSTIDVDYVPENDSVETDARVRGFSSCENTDASVLAGPDGSKCFIATAAYGSRLDPHLESLRVFRDQFMMTNRPGRALVRFYYRHSPPLADFIADRDWLRAVVRGLLTPVVATIEYPMPMALLIFSLIVAVLVRRRRGATAAARVNGSSWPRLCKNSKSTA
jgi:uncharacterized repeat protein (TIGR01451 family)